jgi:tRNA-intron endonuclease, archaea type
MKNKKSIRECQRKSNKTSIQPNLIEINLKQGEFSSNQKKAFELREKSYFGEKKESKIIYSSFEVIYLLEKNKAVIISNNKQLTIQEAIRKILKQDKKFLVNYNAFKDLRDKGYIVKTALKFGAEFRVYEKGVEPGKEHAKWLLFPIKESEQLIWHDFVAKNRIAHSTKKNLLIAIIDEEQDIIYYEIKWARI